MYEYTPEDDIFFMREALTEALSAQKRGEVPVGAVIVRDGKIISRGSNNRESGKTALGHAELNAISEACRQLGGWHLDRCRIYVTLEPCVMCAGAILNAHIPTVVFGAPDVKNGAFGSAFNTNNIGQDRKCEIISGVLAEECANLLSDFFKTLRNRKEEKKQ